MNSKTFLMHGDRYIKQNYFQRLLYFVGNIEIYKMGQQVGFILNKIVKKKNQNNFLTTFFLFFNRVCFVLLVNIVKMPNTCPECPQRPPKMSMKNTDNSYFITP